MTETEEKIERLQTQLDKLVKTQVDFQREVSQIRYEISVLRAVQQKRNLSATEIPVYAKTPTVSDYVPPPKSAEIPAEQQTNQQTDQQTNQQTNQQSSRHRRIRILNPRPNLRLPLIMRLSRFPEAKNPTSKIYR